MLKGQAFVDLSPSLIKMTDAPSEPAADEDNGQLLEAYIGSDEGIIKNRWEKPLPGSIWCIISLKRLTVATLQGKGGLTQGKRR